MFERTIHRLSPENMAKYRRQDLGDLSFQEAIPMLESIRRDLSGVVQMHDSDFPETAFADIVQQLMNQLDPTLEAIEDWRPRSNPNASQDRATMIQNIRTIRDEVSQKIRPYVRFGTAELADAKTEIDALMMEVHHSTNLVENAMTKTNELSSEMHESIDWLKKESVQRANSRVSIYYRESAERHGSTAKIYLYAAAGTGLVLATLVLALFFVYPVKTDVAVQVLIRDAIGRVALLLIPATGLAFCIRNFRVNKHLEVANISRYNALETATLYLEGVTGDTARDLVVAELVRSVFSQVDTGYMATDREQTIVENPSTLMGILAANGKK